MKQGIKKALVMLLSVAMMFTYMAMPVYADEGTFTLEDGDYTVDIASSLSMVKPVSPTALTVNGEDAVLTVTIPSANRYQQIYIGKYEDITEENQDTIGISGVVDGDNITFSIPLKVSQLNDSVFFVVRYIAGYSEEHDGDWYKAKSDHYFTLSNFQKVGGEEEEDADYTAVDAAIASIPEDLTVYTDESVEALNEAVAAVERGKKASEQAEVDAMAAAINDAIAALELKPVEPAGLEDGVYTLPGLAAGPSAMFNHFVNGSRYLIVNGDTATIRFITDGSTASIQKYTKIALGKSSELVQTSYQPTLPEGTAIIEGQLQPYDEGTDKAKYLFEVEITKAEAEALLNNDAEDDIYIIVWNNQGSNEQGEPGWYKPSKDIYLSLGTLGEKTTAPAEAEAFRFTLQVGQYVEGTDFHTASFEGVEYSLKDINGNLYAPSNVTAGMLTYSRLSAANTYTFTATKEGWTVVTQGEWNEDAHAYEYNYLDTDTISVTITSADADKNITDHTNPGMIFRLPQHEDNAVDIALAAVPEDLDYEIFTDESASALQSAIAAADPNEADEEQLNAMAEAIYSALYGLTPKDGSYEVSITKYNGTPYYLYEGLGDSDKTSGKAVLVVENGEMSANLVLKNTSYGQVCTGTKDEVIAEATELGTVPERTIDITLHEDKITVNGKEYAYSTVTVPVSALQKDIAYAYHSSNTTKYTYNTGWYDHGVMYLADSLVPIGTQPSEDIELAVTNTTGMFKVETARLTSADEQTYLVITLSGSSYHEMYRGTYEEAAATDGNLDSWIHGYVNGSGKWEFKIPLTEDDTYIPLVSLSDNYYKKYLNGQNSFARALYPRQVELDTEAETLVAGDYEFTQELNMTNNVKMFKVNGGKLHTVGGPNSNNYAAELILTMGNATFGKMYVGRIAEAEAADETITLEEGNVFTVPVKWVETFGQPETLKTLIGEPFIASFYSTDKAKWYEREITINEENGTLVFNDVFADYSAVDAALAAIPEDLSIYTEESVEVLNEAVAAVVRDKKSYEQAEVDAMAAAINDAIRGLVRISIISIEDADIEEIDAQTYTGSAIEPEPVVRCDGELLVKGTDYTVSYENNVNAGTATLTVTGMGGYAGSVSKGFTIRPKNISKAVVQKINSRTYSGSAFKPTPTVTVDGKRIYQSKGEFTYSYKNNVNAGTATVTATGKGNYTGTVSATFTISPKDISKAVVQKINSRTYSGSAFKPTPTVTVDGKRIYQSKGEFVYGYKNNVNVGIATVTVTGKGNYKGTVSKTFTINPKGTTISGLTGLTKSIKVTWKKQAAQITGYQIMYSTDSKFASYSRKTVSSPSTVSATYKVSYSNKTYYVKVRTYKKVGDKTYYSAWSEAKSVKTK